MSRDKTIEAIAAMIPQKQKLVAASDAASPAPTPIAASMMVRTSEPEMMMVRKTVANSSARSMVYMPPEMKRSLKEIAYTTGRKENDLWLEAMRDWLKQKGM